MKCPICKKDVDENQPTMPFCSARCKQTDLGNWAAERYVISTPVDPNSEVLREERAKQREKQSEN